MHRLQQIHNHLVESPTHATPYPDIVVQNNPHHSRVLTLIPSSSSQQSTINPFATNGTDGFVTMVKAAEQRLHQHGLTLKDNTKVTGRASVLVLLFQRDNEIYVLLTKRSRHLRSHSGQMSLPGGKRKFE